MSRDTEVFESFCRFCLAKFERKTVADALKAAEDHEAGRSIPRCSALPAKPE